MPQYAYISLSAAHQLPNPESYIVRIAKYIPGVQPDLLDSNAYGIPNVLELESGIDGFTPEQSGDITALGGHVFADAATYQAHMDSLVNA